MLEFTIQCGGEFCQKTSGNDTFFLGELVSLCSEGSNGLLVISIKPFDSVFETNLLGACVLLSGFVDSSACFLSFGFLNRIEKLPDSQNVNFIFQITSTNRC